MSAPAIERSTTTTLTPARDGRLVAYTVVTFGVLAAALLMGEAALVPLAIPFALALALGLRRTAPVEVTARVTLFADQVLEGDEVEGLLEMSWSGDFDAHAVIHRLRGITIGARTDFDERVDAIERLEVPFRITAAQWGRHSLGEIWLRLTLPFGLVSWTGRLMVGPSLRVLPGAERLNRLLSPDRSRTAWGVHGSTRLGDGHDFAELRPYVPGDRVRDLNWAATGRHRRPIVNRHHPEVSGDVVIALDARDDGSELARRILTRTARTAWALATMHMRANDRVGLVGLGRSTRWLPPAGGRLAKYMLMETLLGIGGEAADGVTTSRRQVDVPAGALIIGLTPLHDDDTLLTLLRWRARGRSLAVIVIDPDDATAPAATPSERLAARLWGLELDARIAALRRRGVAVVRAPVDGSMGPVISGLRRARQRSGRRVG